MRVRDWRVRTKLAAVLTIPALAFVGVAGLQTTDSVRQAHAMQQFARHVGFAEQVTALVHDLQRERDRAAGTLAAISASAGRAPASQPARVSAELIEDQRAVDKATDALRAAAAPLLGSAGLRTAYDRAMASLAELRQVRAGVQGGWLRQRAAFDTYSTAITDLLGLLPGPVAVGGDVQLTQTVRAVTGLARAKELTAQLRGRLFAVASAGHFAAEEYDAFTDVRAERAAALGQFRADASPVQVAHFDDVVRGPEVRTAARFAQNAVQQAHAADIELDAQRWWGAATAELDLMRTIERSLLTEAVTGATARSGNRWRETVLATAVIAAVLLLALLTSWRIGRAMARSLRTLRLQALNVAHHRLPEAIERLRSAPRDDPASEVDPAAVDSADEIGDVAEAFTAVHRSAVHLAVEQARMRHAVNAMFVNLARRSQSLVERQLQLLDGLETAESNPEQLTNLFRLDHLATRMRRNNENLLVLAGSDGSRRWTEPVALSAALLAAMAEIEQYPRVRHDVSDDIHLAGRAVADVVHLLAELLENATAFSPPDSLVSVTGWQAPDNSSATLMIADRGLGMSPAAIAEANQRLATPAAIDVAASERMGLVVVGHLAARHRIRVELRGSDDGVTAQVWFPGQVLAPPPSRRTAVFAQRRGLPGPDGAAAPEPEPPTDGGPHRSAMVRQAIAAFAAETRSVPAPASTETPPPATGKVDAAAGGVDATAEAGPGTGPAPSRPGNGPATTRAGDGPATSRPGNGATPPRGPRRSVAASTLVGLGPTPADDGEPSRWWSRTGPAQTSAPRVTAPREPVTAGTSEAGLPIRVPMAQLPGSDAPAAAPSGSPPPSRSGGEPDPTRVSSVLSQFYGGAHRATAEEDRATAEEEQNRK